MKTVDKICETCGKDFVALAKEVKRGYGRYCSLSCSAQRPRQPKASNCSCCLCGKRFYRSQSKQRQFMFCSRACQSKAMSLETGDDFVSMRPDHYGTGNSYRAIALEYYPSVCNRCGYDEHPQVLQVHHRDRDRANNSVSNLEVLCPTCHVLEHYSSA